MIAGTAFAAKVPNLRKNRSGSSVEGRAPSTAGKMGDLCSMKRDVAEKLLHKINGAKHIETHYQV